MGAFKLRDLVLSEVKRTPDGAREGQIFGQSESNVFFHPFAVPPLASVRASCRFLLKLSALASSLGMSSKPRCLRKHSMRQTHVLVPSWKVQS